MFNSFFLRKIRFPATIKPRTKIKLNKIKLNIVVPNCDDCKYSQRYSNNSRTNLSCKLYNNLLNDENYIDFYVNTEICRSNEAFCGPKGKYFKQR